MQDRSNGTYMGDNHFPVPYLYDDVDYSTDQDFFGSAPWLGRDQLDNDILIKRYATDGWFPGGVPIGVKQFWCWRNQFSCSNADLVITERTPRTVARGRFARRVVGRLNRLKIFIRILVEQSSMFMFRSAMNGPI